MRKSSYPKVYLLHGYMKEEEIAGLYKCKKIKAFISGTRGEGFGLPFLEAASCNLPVIATNWSGHKDFLDCGKWLTVKYNLNKIPETRADNNIWMKESSWAEVDQSHLSERLIKFYKAPSLPGQWANKLGENVREKFCSEKIEEDYTKILSGYIETC
jgi:glycosyltransferase involved in cell wall biosynthesis